MPSYMEEDAKAVQRQEAEAKASEATGGADPTKQVVTEDQAALDASGAVANAEVVGKAALRSRFGFKARNFDHVQLKANAKSLSGQSVGGKPGSSLIPVPRSANPTLGNIMAARSEQLAKQWKWISDHHTQGIQFDKTNEAIDVDVDNRCRQLLLELDRALACTKEFMDTAVLHGADQRFPTPVLRAELERELDRVLLTQVFEREQVERAITLERQIISAQLRKTEAEGLAKRAEKEREIVLKQMEKADANRAAQLLLDGQRAEAEADDVAAIQRARGMGTGEGSKLQQANNASEQAQDLLQRMKAVRVQYRRVNSSWLQVRGVEAGWYTTARSTTTAGFKLHGLIFILSFVVLTCT